MSLPLADTMVPMNLFADKAPISIDLVYANPVHARNIFAQALYHPAARLWLHEDLAKIVLRASVIVYRQHGWTLQLKDGLRTVEAQTLMQGTDISKANPQWNQPGEKRLLSPPGAGAHPRGMAIDVCAINENGREVDMGTPFDYLTTDPANNPAARTYTNLPDEILQRRRWLEEAFVASAHSFGLPLNPLTSEWWDFRFPTEIYSQHNPLYDRDLPPWMQMTGRPMPVMPDDIADGFDKRAEALLNTLDETLQNAS